MNQTGIIVIGVLGGISLLLLTGGVGYFSKSNSRDNSRHSTDMSEAKLQMEKESHPNRYGHLPDHLYHKQIASLKSGGKKRNKRTRKR
jgi:hypothetical protein